MLMVDMPSSSILSHTVPSFHTHSTAMVNMRSSKRQTAGQNNNEKGKCPGKVDEGSPRWMREAWLTVLYSNNPLNFKAKVLGLENEGKIARATNHTHRHWTYIIQAKLKSYSCIRSCFHNIYHEYFKTVVVVFAHGDRCCKHTLHMMWKRHLINICSILYCGAGSCEISKSTGEGGENESKPNKLTWAIKNDSRSIVHNFKQCFFQVIVLNSLQQDD